MPVTNTKQEPATGAKVTLREISRADVFAALREGWLDWVALPGISIAIAAVYTVGGWLLIALLTTFDLPYLVYPTAMGFALVAPFVAVGFYAVSRRRQLRRDVTLGAVWRDVSQAAGRDLRWMALITSFAFFIWMDIAAMLTLSFFGATALDLRVLLQEIVTTEAGWLFLAIGHAVGAAIALLVFSISVVTYPMLYDRDVDVLTAMATSLRVIRQNPASMLTWFVIIAATMAIAFASALLLLPLVLPLLGYASWHLYQRAVEPEPDVTT